MTAEDPDQNLHEQLSALVKDDAGVGLTLAQKFEVAKFANLIRSANNQDELRRIAILLLQAWQTQLGAANFLLSQNTGWKPGDVRPHPIDS